MTTNGCVFARPAAGEWREMELEKTREALATVAAKLAEGDALLIVHFCKATDKYEAKQMNLDAGDALLVIADLMESYELLPEAVLESVKGQAR